MSSSALPLRPLTIGELLDAAVQLVRRQPVGLLGMSALLTAAELGGLIPLMLELVSDFWTFMLFLGLMAGAEALILVLLGSFTGPVAAAELTGTALSTREFFRRGGRGVLPALPGALLAAALTGFCALGGPVWVVGYSIFGLAGVAVSVERRGAFRALGRSFGVSAGIGMRPVGVRLLGAIAWLLLRVGFVLGVQASVSYLPVTPDTEPWVVIGGLFIANTVTFATLAALDAVTLIEARYRMEGLDIRLTRTLAGAPLTPELLVAARR